MRFKEQKHISQKNHNNKETRNKTIKIHFQTKKFHKTQILDGSELHCKDLRRNSQCITNESACELTKRIFKEKFNRGWYCSECEGGFNTNTEL